MATEETEPSDEAPPSYKSSITLTKDDVTDLKQEKKTNKVKVKSPEVNVKETLTDDETGEKFDLWALPELKNKSQPWKELDTKRRVKRVLFHYTFRILLLIGLLYMFICSLDFLSSAFRLLGGKAAGRAFADNELLANPIAGLMVGVLATVLVQSSSTSTSIVVTMVAADIMYVRTAIPIVMGANIGTSVTNTIVSIGHISDREEFRRAFAGAVVHDMFNWLSVLILLPIEIATGYLYYLSKVIVNSMDLETYTSGKKDLLKAITKPFTSLIVQIDKKVISEIAKNVEGAEEKPLLKYWCKYKKEPYYVNETVSTVEEVNGVNMTVTEMMPVLKNRRVGIEKCFYMFVNVARTWGDEVVGAVMLVIALLILCTCLVLIVKTLNALLRGRIAVALKKFVNADFPGKCCSHFTGYVAILLGAGLTILVQSSSIFTSALTPLVGIGVLSLDRMYPLTLGANIGTTATGILASLAATGNALPNAMQVAFCHLFFNITGILIFYPIPIMRKGPINLAKFMGIRTHKYRWFPLFYLVIVFFLVPAAGFGLSLAAWYAVILVFAPIILLVIIILIIKLIQRKKPECLPPKMRNWKWLPEPMRSLAPIDRLFRKVRMFILTTCCARCCKIAAPSTADDEIDKQTDGAVVVVIAADDDIDKPIDGAVVVVMDESKDKDTKDIDLLVDGGSTSSAEDGASNPAYEDAETNPTNTKSSSKPAYINGTSNLGYVESRESLNTMGSDTFWIQNNETKF